MRSIGRKARWIPVVIVAVALVVALGIYLAVPKVPEAPVVSLVRQELVEGP